MNNIIYVDFESGKVVDADFYDNQENNNQERKVSWKDFSSDDIPF